MPALPPKWIFIKQRLYDQYRLARADDVTRIDFVYLDAHSYAVVQHCLHLDDSQAFAYVPGSTEITCFGAPVVMVYSSKTHVELQVKPL